MKDRSPQQKEKQTSPLKVKDYFTNPLHRIKQSAFTEVGFSVSALNTFVKNFTSKNNNKYISLQEVREYVKKFTNNNQKLMQMYLDFFNKNFKQKDGLIQVEHFVQFFIKETKQEQKSEKSIKKIYEDIKPLNWQNLMTKAEYLQIPMTEEEAKKIVKMINYTHHATGNQISYENFYDVAKKNI